MEKLLSVGKILNFHGIHGEVKVGYTEDKKDQLTQIKEFIISDIKPVKTLTVESIRFHKNVALIKFKEINSINDANEYKGTFLKVPKKDLESFLEKDEFYIDDLISLDCYDINGKYIGKVSSVVDCGSEDILGIKDENNKEYFVPFVKDLVPEINIKDRKITIKNIEGLLEEAEA